MKDKKTTANKSNKSYELVLLRNEFFKDKYVTTLFFMIVSLIVNLLLIFNIYYLWAHKPKPLYFPTDGNGSLIKMHPLNQKLYDDTFVKSWLSSKAIEINNFDFLNYKIDFARLSQYFTEYGFTDYLQKLKSSRNFSTVLAGKFVTSANVCSMPQIIKQEVQNIQGNSTYVWVLQLPLVISYVNNIRKINKTYMALVVVQRVSNLKYKDGLAITNWVMAEHKFKNGLCAKGSF